MKKTIDVGSWVEFPQAVADVKSQYGTLIRELSAHTCHRKNDVLFRGQASNDWQLSTTLERCTEKRYSVSEYLQIANSCVHEIESETGKRWHLKDYPEIVQDITGQSSPVRPPPTLRLPRLPSAPWIPVALARLDNVAVHRRILRV